MILKHKMACHASNLHFLEHPQKKTYESHQLDKDLNHNPKRILLNAIEVLPTPKFIK
jgi:hypothetical protein